MDFIRYFCCACLTRPPDFLSRFRNLAGAMQIIRIDKIESQVASAEEAVITATTFLPTLDTGICTSK